MADTKDDTLDWSLAAHMASPSDSPTVDEALAGPDASIWKEAMESEVATLKKMGTYEPVELPPGRKAIGNKWVLTLKRDENESAGLQTAYAAHTPMTPNIQLTQFKGTKPKFNYGMFIAQFTTCYGPAHVTAVKHVIRYLEDTSLRGLMYRRSNDRFGEIGYSDADWGSNFLDPISWSAKKQPTVALLTMEAEYMALSHACTQALWFRQFFDEIGHKADAPTLILSDNLAALTLSVESQYHGRSKHIHCTL
ncbi:Copia-like polyprotein/retrotransposon [Ceratobasidium sp. AG-Ba]|nr:Copia-like polyprotein/retrotransposon [Ceratobasidium sp. AG-Ba]QRW14271.1 Copia-like polyprotein/retrotransposon [Ceratobasidium sp. AG-Ba]